jgi:hypothetical protein
MTTNNNLVLVMCFNAFSRKLGHAYWARSKDKKRIGNMLTPSEAYKLLAQWPETLVLHTDY